MTKSMPESFWTLVEDTGSQYIGRPIVVLGKGASADDVDAAALAQAFIVGINDSGLVARTNFTVFHEEWVWDQLKDTETVSSAFLSAVPVGDAPRNYFIGRFEPSTQENSELMLQRLFSDSLAIEEVMFLTALRIALRAAKAASTSDIYFVGFDFSLDKGFSKRVDASASGVKVSRARQWIESQERIFLSVRSFLAQRGIELRHVGYRRFSDLTPAAFSERVLHLGSRAEKTEAHDLLITAEITTNHLGDLSRAKRMMRLASDQGADLVKFQMRDVETFYSQDVLNSVYPSPFGTTFREYRQSLEFSDDDFREIARYAVELGVAWFASVLDSISLDRAVRLNMPIIKLPGTISRKRDFLASVAERYQGDIVLSTGMSSQEYIDWLIDTFRGSRRVYLLHANSAYPTPLEDCNVSIVSNYAKLSEIHPRIVPGYSSHDDGWFGSALAVASGARMLEKHVKLGSSEWIHFDNVALDLETGEFASYVEAVRRARVAVGVPEKRITPSEHHKY